MQSRIPGLTHQGDDEERNNDFKIEALQEIDELHNRINKGGLVNFRDVINQQKASVLDAGRLNSRQFFDVVTVI